VIPACMRLAPGNGAAAETGGEPVEGAGALDGEADAALVCEAVLLGPVPVLGPGMGAAPHATTEAPPAMDATNARKLDRSMFTAGPLLTGTASRSVLRRTAKIWETIDYGFVSSRARWTRQTC
jgi:hypothetical protein